MTGTAAIIGGGVIGGAWAARFLLMGWDVRLFDPDPEADRKMAEVMENARWALPMLYERALPAEGRLTRVATVAEAVEGVDYIQESVPERLDVKHRVYAEIEVTNRSAPIGSSTSGFKPSELREGLATGGRLLVAHPFNPVYLLPLVEVVPGDGADADILRRATGILEAIGLFPLHVRKEIDAHIADRFLEAVWREALWLIKDGVATTEEIDESIRMGFGLRWAQMGLFDTYRCAGGEGGMAHFIAQFGPALSWPWTKLMDVPELTPELIETIGAQSDAQSGDLTLRELERVRDRNLVAMMRALKGQNSAAGAHIAKHEALLPPASPSQFTTIRRTIPIDWTDYNGHMNEGRYGQVFSDACDSVMKMVGADSAYIADGLSYFTVETNVKYLAETHAGEAVIVDTEVILAEGKKLKLHHVMKRETDGEVLATCDQFCLHVSLETRKSCPPREDVAAGLARLTAAAAQHKET
ncbi:MAG: carnitine 3-dehydrogenase [Paracoccaceae bacterium]|nr:carnitine 3-dehydrogenase [Paracoccaceae bacterium]